MTDQTYHPVLGAACGGLQAVKHASEQAGPSIFLEAIGGGIAGFAAGRFHAIAANEERYKSAVAHGELKIGTLGTIKSEVVVELQQTFRSIAAESAQKAQRATGDLARIGHQVVQILMLIAAGAVIGFPAGYIAHLAAQGQAPKEFVALPNP